VSDDRGDDGERRGITPTIAVSIALGVAILLAVAWYLGGNRDPDQDKLTNPQIEQAREADPSKRCAAASTFDLVKRELFRRAAEVRGKDEPAFAQIAATAALRVENPVLESQEAGTLNCSGTFYLELPAGVVIPGGRRSLTADVDYALQPGGGVGLGNAEAIISALATIERVAEPPAEDMNAVEPQENVAASVSAKIEPGSATTAPARPSYNCARAETPGEIAVCNDSGLAALDVNMAAQYRRALTTASPTQLRLLQTTRDRFLAYRDDCPDRRCIANAYVGRMREIRDIMEGRLTPSR
jgi:hypothetical protein